MKKLALILMSVLTIFTLTACGGRFLKDSEIKDVPADKNPVGVITISYELNDREIFAEQFSFELYYKEAPITVTNFVSLIESKFYEGLIFHRFETMSNDNKVLQGGGYREIYDDYDVMDLKKSDLKYSIMGEFKSNGWEKNTLKHLNGSLAMARTDDKNSASSQFYISIGENRSLDNDYAVFGRITNNTQFFTDLTSLVETSNFISEDEGTFSTMPKGKLYIKSIVVDTKGISYGDPLKIK